MLDDLRSNVKLIMTRIAVIKKIQIDIAIQQ